MRICIIGGALQGMEAVLLSQKAGFETTVIDRKATAPAASLADTFVHCDILADDGLARRTMSDCDAVLPAFEDLDGLRMLDRTVPGLGKPLLFDMHAYEVSCSKEESNRIMAGLDVPMPEPWPGCGFPVVVKPSSQSGSVGVSVAHDEDRRLKAVEAVRRLGDTPVQQEFVSGKSVSIEVIGDGEGSRAFVTTEVVLDRDYDCKQVVCEPGILDEAEQAEFESIGTRIADGIGLTALMDVEAIRTRKGLRVLEIDARIPSQTPAAVEAATGVNLVEELVLSASGKETSRTPAAGCSVYEHYVAGHGRLSTCGEKEFGRLRTPRIHEGLFGADTVITDYLPGTAEWRATVINAGKTSSEVLRKRKAFIERAMRECDLFEYTDRSPEAV